MSDELKDSAGQRERVEPPPGSRNNSQWVLRRGGLAAAAFVVFGLTAFGGLKVFGQPRVEQVQTTDESAPASSAHDSRVLETVMTGYATYSAHLQAIDDRYFSAIEKCQLGKTAGPELNTCYDIKLDDQVTADEWAFFDAFSVFERKVLLVLVGTKEFKAFLLCNGEQNPEELKGTTETSDRIPSFAVTMLVGPGSESDTCLVKAYGSIDGYRDEMLKVIRGLSAGPEAARLLPAASQVGY